MEIVFIVLGVAMGLIVFKLGSDDGWHWGGSIAAALVPIGFSMFLGVIGLIISAFFVAAVWKATS